MRDLEERLRGADEVSGPDLWALIESKADAEIVHKTPTHRGAKLAVAAAFVAVFVGAIMWAGLAIRDRHTTPVAPTGLPQGWTQLPSPPEVRDGASMVWAGDRLLVWGGTLPGSAQEAANGYSFDPATRSWREIAAAPIARTGSVGVWTGTQAIFLGGSTLGVQIDDGAAFDPTTGAWRSIPAAPVDLTGSRRPAIVWTGREVIVWGGSPSEAASVRGAAFDPTAWTWHPIADAPLGMNLTNAGWTGERVLVVGSLLASGNIPATHSAIAEAYDPSTDKWHRLPDPPLSPQATAGGWVGDRFVAFDPDAKAATFGPTSDRWVPTTRMPFAASECYPDGAVVSQTQYFAWFCGNAAVYDIATGSWSSIDGGATNATVQANGRPYPLWDTATVTSGAGVVYLDAQGITIDSAGAPCFGCSGSPRSYWAYRLPNPSNPNTYPTTLAFAHAIRAAGVGCLKIGVPLGGVTASGNPLTCDVQGGSATIYVDDGTFTPWWGTVPKHWVGVSWVRGPNWLLATDSRAAAVAVHDALGGELLGGTSSRPLNVPPTP